MSTTERIVIIFAIMAALLLSSVGYIAYMHHQVADLEITVTDLKASNESLKVANDSLVADAVIKENLNLELRQRLTQYELEHKKEMNKLAEDIDRLEEEAQQREIDGLVNRTYDAVLVDQTVDAVNDAMWEAYCRVSAACEEK